MKEGCNKSGPVPLKCHVPAHQHTADGSHGRVMLVMIAVVCQEREHGAAAARKDSARTWGTTVHTHMQRCPCGVVHVNCCCRLTSTRPHVRKAKASRTGSLGVACTASRLLLLMLIAYCSTKL